MDRRAFLKGVLATGALAGLGPGCIFPDNNKRRSVPETPDVPFDPRDPDGHLTPYLLIPKLDQETAGDPAYQGWSGAQWNDVQHAPHGFWFQPPDLGQSVDVVVPVINLGTRTSYHTVVELYEGPRTTEQALANCQLRQRLGPIVLHPGRIKGVRMTYTRMMPAAASVAICYDPFFDPIHAIASVGIDSLDRKNLGGSMGLRAPTYPGYAGG